MNCQSSHIDSMCVIDPFATSPKQAMNLCLSHSRSPFGFVDKNDVKNLQKMPHVMQINSGAMHYYSILHWPNDGADWMILDSLDRGANDDVSHQ